MRLRFLAMGAVTAAALAGSFGLQLRTQASEQPEERTGNVIVKFNETATLSDVGSALTDAETEPVASTAPSGLVLLEPDPGQSVDAAVADLEANPEVEFA